MTIFSFVLSDDLVNSAYDEIKRGEALLERNVLERFRSIQHNAINHHQDVLKGDRIKKRKAKV